MPVTAAFFTTEDSFAARFDALSRQLGLRAESADELRIWQRGLAAQLRRTLGLDTMAQSLLDPVITERVACAGYTRERVLIQTEPGVVMPLYVLIPDGLMPGEHRPAVLAPHGHSSGGKYAVAGRRDLPAVAATIEEHNYDYGVQFVRQGLVVFCPDARGFGERREAARQDEANLLFGSCNLLNHMAIPLGQTVTGMWTWDLMRLVDYAQTRPEVDPARIACGGLSGGGLQTLWLAALDERVCAAVISGYFYGYKDSLLRLNDNCSCNYVPGLWSLADIGDIAALIAPRPLFIETGDADSLNGPRGMVNVTEQLAITCQAYDLLGAGAHVRHHIFPGPHMWCGEQSVPWLRGVLEE